ncbi:class I SAM-dependent methyltransferase [Baekduia sp. Peel2402]|uniref:class I SAM-dependent methyltransferase n=1 Tax=Baekduia sp. Peel2402 TaxID=3458296 RepID=UPI00403E67EE
MTKRVKSLIKRLVGDRGVQVVRSLGRFRYGAKIMGVKRAGWRFRDAPWMLTKYVLFDPEFDNFTYELANVDELVATLAPITGVDETALRGYYEEIRTDPALTDELARRLRWRLDVKTRPPLGRRYSWYMLARALKPQLIVESGTQDGLGALALLRALERNADEGRPGELLSVDLLATAGWMVPPEHRARWTLRNGSVDEVLAAELPARPPVGLMIEDTGAPAAVVAAEFATVAAHASDNLVLVACPTAHHLDAFCAQRGLDAVVHHDRAHDHFFQGSATTFARLKPAPAA